jgi:pyruvate/2-oxoglutarate dehydrogenase complex dihydrolipoamide acyltransferase (E2) component
MPIFGRYEGTFVKKAPTLRRMMPFLMPTRNEAVVYFEQQIDVGAAVAFAAERKVTLFALVICALVRTMAERPDLNRFIVGRRIYQRRWIEMSFAVKKQKTDAGKLTTVKVRLDPAATLEATLAAIEGSVGEGRGEKKLQSEKEMDLITLLPRMVVRFLVWMQTVLDYFNLLPASLLASDPMYSSVFLANLGSVGLDSAYHHLFEYGTVPIFATIGRVKKGIVVGPGDQPVVRDVVSIKYSFDERIADGIYCARALDRFKAMIEDPATLAAPSGAL